MRQRRLSSGDSGQSGRQPIPSEVRALSSRCSTCIPAPRDTTATNNIAAIAAAAVTAARSELGRSHPLGQLLLPSTRPHRLCPERSGSCPSRIDWNLHAKDQLYFRARIDHGTQATYADPINPAFSAASYQPAYDGQFGWTHEFSPNATNQFSADLSHYHAIFTQQNPGLFPYAVIPHSAST